MLQRPHECESLDHDIVDGLVFNAPDGSPVHLPMAAGYPTQVGPRPAGAAFQGQVWPEGQRRLDDAVFARSHLPKVVVKVEESDLVLLVGADDVRSGLARVGHQSLPSLNLVQARDALGCRGRSKKRQRGQDKAKTRCCRP